MKLTTTLIHFLFITLVASRSFSLFGDQSPLNPEDNDLKVPGKNPLTFCQDPKDDILAIEYVDLTPNPPEAGKTLTIEGSGTFSEDIEEGAKVLLQVKYGLITLVRQEADLCDQIQNVNLTCPIKEGDAKFTKNVELPKQIPPGKYTVLADVYTKDKKKITCLEAAITFSP